MFCSRTKIISSNESLTSDPTVLSVTLDVPQCSYVIDPDKEIL